MKQPTLEEVKEYFKNAKEVKCLSDGKVYDISKKLKEEINECAGSFWCMTKKSRKHGGSIELFNQYKYAEILTYKEKTFSITESQINELKESLSLFGMKERLKEWFPEAFESEVKLEVGKWYKSTISESISMFNGINKESYGIHTSGKEWIQSHKWFFTENEDFKKWIEATEQEVFEALKNEAVKRGFVKGCFYSNAQYPGNEEYAKSNQYSAEHLFEFGSFYLDGNTILYKGKWAEIIESITLSEAEQQLGKKIIV